MTIKQIRLDTFIDVNEIRDQGRIAVEVQANAAECAALAERCDILAVDNLTARLTLTSSKGSDLVKIQVKLDATIDQACIVTLGPVKEEIHENYTEVHTTSEEALVAPDDVDGTEDQPIELIENEKVDIKELVAQWIVLSMDPFPRSADTPFYEHIEQKTNEEGTKTHTPFSVLEKLKK